MPRAGRELAVQGRHGLPAANLPQRWPQRVLSRANGHAAARGSRRRVLLCRGACISVIYSSLPCSLFVLRVYGYSFSRIFPLYFHQYEIFCRALTPEGSSRADLSPWRLMLAGSLGGIAYWTSFFPGALKKYSIRVWFSSICIAHSTFRLCIDFGS